MKYQGLSQCDTFSFPCGKGKDPVALIYKCCCGRLSLHKCHRSEATQDIGWQIAGSSQVMVSSVLDIVESLNKRVVSCSASDRQGHCLESCVWRAASFHSSHHSQEVSLAQFSLYVHKGGLKLIYFISVLDDCCNSLTRKIRVEEEEDEIGGGGGRKQ